MSGRSTPWALARVPPDQPPAASGAATDYFTQVAVHAGILHATAETLELIHDFFNHADPVLCVHLGRFLIARRPDDDIGDPTMEAIILLNELSEAADLLQALAGEETPA
jgi:hypothetical protein